MSKKATTNPVGQIFFMLLMKMFFLLLGIMSCNLNSPKVVPTKQESDTTPTVSKCRISLDLYSKKYVYINYDTAPSFEEKLNDVGKYIYDNFDQGKNEPFQGAFSIACIINKEGELCYPRVVKKKKLNILLRKRSLSEFFCLCQNGTQGNVMAKLSIVCFMCHLFFSILI